MAILAAASVLLAGCGPGGGNDLDERPAPAALVEPIPVRLGLPEQPGSALLYIALARSHLAEAGLAVEVTTYPSGKRALHEGLLAGEVDVIGTAEVPVALYGLEVLDGEPPAGPLPRILASIFSADDINRVVTRAHLGIEEPTDLRGRAVATQRASAVHFFWHLFSLENGIHDPENLRFMPAEALPEALADGRIDAFAMREPYVSQAQRLLGEETVVFSAPGLYTQRELLLIDGRFAAAHPQAPRRILWALLAAERFARRDAASAAQLVADGLGVDPAEILAFWPSVTLHVRLDQGLLLLLEEEARWAQQARLVSGRGPSEPLPNYLELIDSAPLRAEQPHAVTLIR